MAIITTAPLGAPPWATLDPFLFCVHHRDAYPEGNEDMGPKASLAGRNIGMDFANKDGWNMYHGDKVPGFPMHPHRGFETITIARSGYIDHSDSTGATARFGEGDVQWMTAGNGVVHSEMFPLVNQDAPNPGELFQIWLNLPREDKSADPYFTMFWHEQVPVHRIQGDGGESIVRVIAGEFEGLTPPKPPPNSWASREEADIGILTMKLAPGGEVTIPAAKSETIRVFYFFEGSTLEVNGESVSAGHAIQVEPDAEITLKAGDELAEVLMLQGRPIGEPVVQQGPFVVNYPGEIRQAMIDYHQTGFGGWPFDTEMPVHPREAGRFAIHSDGRREEPGESAAAE